jgi:hypothetical protein
VGGVSAGLRLEDYFTRADAAQPPEVLLERRLGDHQAQHVGLWRPGQLGLRARREHGRLTGSGDRVLPAVPDSRDPVDREVDHVASKRLRLNGERGAVVEVRQPEVTDGVGMFGTVGAHLSAQDVYLGTLLGALDSIDAGVTGV